MAINLTKSQQAAVDARGRSLMISAAAGSGKTATLTRRIISLLTDPNEPADISKMLIVTFTRAAASELKSRITDALSKALEEDPDNSFLGTQLTSVGGADICTIDSYYLRLVKDNFQKVGLPAVFRIADEGETDLLRQEVAEECVEYLFEKEPSFRHFAETLTGARGELTLPELLSKLEAVISAHPKGTNVLLECAERFRIDADKDFFQTVYGRTAYSYALSVLGNIEHRANYIRELINSEPAAEPYRDANEADLTFASEAETILRSKDYARFRNKLASYQPQKMGSVKKADKTEGTEAISSLRDKNKKLLKELSEGIFKYTQDAIGAAMRGNAVFCEEAEKAVSAYASALEDKKKNRLCLEFSDLKRYALMLLIADDGTPTDVALAERDKYTHIFVDEYQDTDSVQDSIFRTVSNGSNLFIVGDIKQSIYSFRGAEPTVFSAYRKEFPVFDVAAADGVPGAIYMSENFRCAENVIAFTNMICGRLFSETGENGNGIGYRPEDDLIFSRRYEKPLEGITGASTDGDRRVGVILSESYKDGPDPKDLELLSIVDRITELKAHGVRADGKPYEWGDFAILARGNRFLDRATAMLSARGIPVSNCAGDDLFENAEVSLLFSLLSAIDNPMKDVPLAGALISPVFGFSLDELVTIRTGRKKCALIDALESFAEDPDSPEELSEKCRASLRRLSSMRKRAELLPLSRFIRSLWKETDAIEYAGADKGSKEKSPAERRQNLQRLYSLALSYEASDYRTLHDFVRYISELIDRGTTIKSDNMPGGNAVQLMTVHKSKGLEFPVVFIAETSKGFNTDEAKDVSIFTGADGLGQSVKLTDALGLASEDNVMRSIAAKRIIELSAEEEIRVLYVALTRARDLLYITASGREGFAEKLIRSGKDGFAIGGRAQVLGGKNWAEWISAATNGFTEGSSYSLSTEAAVPEEEAPADAGTDEAPADAGSGKGGRSVEAAQERTTGPVSAGSCDTVSNGNGAPGALEKSEDGETEETGNDPEIERYKALLKKNFEFSYPFSAASSLPSKLSVSRLFPDALTEPGEDAVEGDDPHADTLLALIQAEQLERSEPDFMSDDITGGAAEKGTATHLFLQFCDFDKLDGTPCAAAEEAARLATEGFIPANAVKLIMFNEIARFSSSKLFREMRASASLRREMRFNLFLPAGDFTTDEARKEELKGEKIAVQGVIDIFFEAADGTLVLCDYKTDRLKKAEMSSPGSVAAIMTERHGRQLGYYADALEQICGRRPGRICVFPLCYGEAVDISI